MVNKYPEDMIVNLDKLTYAGNLETCKPVEGKPNYKFVKGDIADREFIFDLFKKESRTCQIIYSDKVFLFDYGIDRHCSGSLRIFRT